MPPQNGAERYHALDCLRAVMMLLGVVLHAAMNHMVFPAEGIWPFKDPETSLAFDVAFNFIHVFRMPIFFLAAGFFAALLCARRGAAAFAANRARRVIGPLVVGWLALWPLSNLIVPFASDLVTAGTTFSWREIGHAILDWRGFRLMHLWFLWYLVVFYGVALALHPVLRRAGLGPRLHRLQRALLEAWWGPLCLAPVCLVLLVLNAVFDPRSGTETIVWFVIPKFWRLAVYLQFFAFGWLLYGNRRFLSRLEAWAWAYVASACLLYGVYWTAFYNIAYVRAGLLGLWVPLWWVSDALMKWLFVFGITGLFLRYAETPRPVVRYVSDASYWIYLVHLPLVFLFGGLVSLLPLPAIAKFSLTVAATAAAALLTYDVAVRPTALGQWLNGRRYPRGLPAREDLAPRHKTPAPAGQEV